MQKNLLILLLLLSNNFIYSQDQDQDIINDIEIEESSSLDFGELEEPEFHEPSKFEVLMARYGIRVLQSYLDLKKWVLDQLD